MKASELRQKAVEELEKELLALRREQFSLRMQRGSTGQASKPHLFERARRDVARIKTILAEKVMVEASP